MRKRKASSLARLYRSCVPFPAGKGKRFLKYNGAVAAECAYANEIFIVAKGPQFSD
jgi:hypothetical protein